MSVESSFDEPSICGGVNITGRRGQYHRNIQYINYADMDDATYNISEEDKELNYQFYNS